MNKFMFAVLLFFCGCGVLKVKPKKSIKNTNGMLIHATVESDNLLLAISKIRTKIKISSDTISASVYPFVALELGKLILTKEKVVFQNKYTNQNDSIFFKRTDFINIKTFQKSFIQKTLPSDTIEYKNPYRNCFFTNYVFVEKYGRDSLFLPQKIIIKNTQKEKALGNLDEIKIDYKSVNLF